MADITKTKPDIHPRKFMVVESTQIPLKEIPLDEVKIKIIDPVTGKPYKGLILEGIFADLSNVDQNNNKRYYDVPKYLELLKKLKYEMLYGRGVYGELEHPAGYSVNYNNVSHKIIDIWFDEKTKMVWGRIILLQTPTGIIAEQIIRSGGLLAMSGRAAGDEIQNPDGSFMAVVKLLTTFDIIYHPGFALSTMKFKSLNESQQLLQNAGESKKGFSGLIYENDFDKIPQLFENYKDLNEHDKCFMEFCLSNIGNAVKTHNIDYVYKNLNENQEQQEQFQSQEQIIEDGTTNDQQQLEDNLQDAVDIDLTEQLKQSLKQSQEFLKKHLTDNTYFDNAAGFLMNKTEGIDTLIESSLIEDKVNNKLESL